MTKAKQAFLDRLRKYRGRFREVAEGSGVKYDAVRKYAQGVLPNKRQDGMKAISAWMRSNKP